MKVIKPYVLSPCLWIWSTWMESVMILSTKAWALWQNLFKWTEFFTVHFFVFENFCYLFAKIPLWDIMNCCAYRLRLLQSPRVFNRNCLIWCWLQTKRKCQQWANLKVGNGKVRGDFMQLATLVNGIMTLYVIVKLRSYAATVSKTLYYRELANCCKKRR